MPLFEYSGRSKDGNSVRGQLEAQTSQLVAAQLLADGITPLHIDVPKVTARREDPLERWLSKLRSQKVTSDDLVMFARQMYSLTRAGVPITRTLHGLSETTRNPGMARVLREVGEDLASGRELAAAMQRHPKVFTNLVVSLVHVGETAGQLEQSFQQMFEYLELEQDTRKRIGAAARYPMIVIGAIVVAMVVLNIFVIPKFVSAYGKFDAALPLPTRIIIGTSELFTNYWPVMLLGSIVGFFSLKRYLNTDYGRLNWDRIKLRLPLVGGVFERATLARFARTLAVTLHSGVPMIQALTLTARAVGNAWMCKRLLEMREGIQHGDSLAGSARSSGLFTPLVLQMMSVGEETGSVDELLAEVGQYYEREVDYDLKKLSDSIEPILIAAIGGIVLVIALGIYLPMWSLGDAALSR